MNFTEDKLQPIITKQYSSLRIAIFLFLSMSIGAATLAVLVVRDTRTRADVLRPSPSPFLEIRPSPLTSLEGAYVRLISTRTKFGLSDTISVDVYLSTKGSQVVELDLYILYDPKKIDIDEQGVKNTDVFKTMGVDVTEKGRLMVTLFNTLQVGHPSVDTKEEELKIATLQFKAQAVEDPKVEIKIDFKKGNAKKSLLVPYEVVRPEIVESILESVEGVTFEIGS